MNLQVLRSLHREANRIYNSDADWEIIPCPYCGTDNDRKHDVSRHVDKRLGVPV